MPSLASCAPALHCEVRGSGTGRPAVALLHGLGSSSADWSPLLPFFDPEQRLLLVDLPGHGRSARLAGRPSIDGMAAAVAARLEGMIGDDPVHVLGLSLGGCVALALALRIPARVRSLVLVSAFARLRPANPAAVRRLLTRLTLLAVAPRRMLAAHVAGSLFPRPEQHALFAAAVDSLARTPRRSYLAGLRALGAFDARARLSAVRCPVLVVAGARDATVPLAVQRALAAAVPGAQLAILPESGHAPPYDAPEAFARAALPFIAAN